MLFLALFHWPYGYYQILRWVVCGVCGWSAFVAVNVNRRGWAWGMGTIAVLFNPIVPIYLTREIWSVIDLTVGITLLVSLRLLKAEHRLESKDE